MIYAEPPSLLLRDIPPPEPPGAGAANLELQLYAIELQQALDEANNDKRALRDFLAQPPPQVPPGSL